MKKICIILTILSLTCICFADSKTGKTDEKLIHNMLDKFHKAAAKADEKEYFGLMAEDIIYLGTATEERWTKKTFLEYARPYFSKGRGWNYKPFDRYVMFTGDGKTAWFDEKLKNDYYGLLRGTGVVRKDNGKWKVVHYSMTLVVPNDLFKKITDIIQKK